MNTRSVESFKMVLREKLAESFKAPASNVVARHVHGKIRFPGKATAIIGMRRAGKTTLLHQLRREQHARGTPYTHLPYLNFEDERLAGIEADALGFLLSEHARLLADSQSRKPVLWSFDEIQLVPKWEQFVRRILDSSGFEVCVSGSSATMLSSEIATSLRGRGWSVALYPFSFAEYLSAHALSDRFSTKTPLTAKERAALEFQFKKWLHIGGFPEAQFLAATERERLLKDYVDVAILRDVVERHNVSNITALRWLVRHLLGNAGSLFSAEKFYAALKSQGLSVSKDTVHQLLTYVEDCFLVRTVWMDTENERKRMANLRKIYSIDSALLPLFDRSGRSNIGHALEGAVLIELERRHQQVCYVRTEHGFEVDFCARGPNHAVELIQVCADASAPDVAEREIRALLDAAKEYPKAKKKILTLTQDGLPSSTPRGITAQTAYEWMLQGR